MMRIASARYWRQLRPALRWALRWALGRVLQVVRQGASDGERVDAGSFHFRQDPALDGAVAVEVVPQAAQREAVGVERGIGERCG